MLKGHVFKKQRFGNEIFALFIDTFLNGKNGISNNYKNSMDTPSLPGDEFLISSLVYLEESILCILKVFLFIN